MTMEKMVRQQHRSTNERQQQLHQKQGKVNGSVEERAPKKRIEVDQGGTMSTRVCIKNLPPFMTSKKLKEFLQFTTTEQQNNNRTQTSDIPLILTDCRIIPKSSSANRNKEPHRRGVTSTTTTAIPNIAFCGFATSSMAEYVIRTFHRSYIGTFRILVEPAVKRDNQTLLKPQHCPQESKVQTTEVALRSQKTPLERSRKNPQKPKIWSNDDDFDIGFVTEMSGEKQITSSRNDGDTSSTDGSYPNDDKHPTTGNEDDDDGDNSVSTTTSTSSNAKSSQGENDNNNNNNNNETPPSANNWLSDLDFTNSKRKNFDDLDDDDSNINDKKISHLEPNDFDVNNQGKVDEHDTRCEGDDDDNNDNDESRDDGDDGIDVDDVGSENDQTNKESSKQQQQASFMNTDCNDDDDVPAETKSNFNHDASKPPESSHHVTLDIENHEDPNRLFVRNLPFSTTESDLRQLFQQFGTLTECHVPLISDEDIDDPDQLHSHDNKNKNDTSSMASDAHGHNKGFAFVSFTDIASASQARNQLDGSDFQGRLLHILPARKVPPIDGKKDRYDDDLLLLKNLPFKQRQAILARRREQDTTSIKNNWSSSFVRGDAVVDSLAEQLGLRKADFLNAKQDGMTAGDAAVRLALGETHVIEENRTYFRSFGIDMDALVLAKAEATAMAATSGRNEGKSNTVQADIARSKTCILVKNLPFSTTLSELTKVFHGVTTNSDDSDDGKPLRILLPPSRTVALVEYSKATHAKRAFRGLAYKRFQHVPLYLEWAPLAALNNQSIPNEEVTGDRNDSAVAVRTPLVSSTDLNNISDTLDDDAIPGISHSIYVKNLNFSTTESTLKKVFSVHATVRAVKIPQKIAPIQKGGSASAVADAKTLSLGYGFVELASADDVQRVIPLLQGTWVDGYALELKPSNKAIAPRHSQQSKASSTWTQRTKIFVRNVAFQASRKELLQLFGSFGQLRKVRLPKKFDGTHRGFAFCEYVTHKEAEAAMQSLSQTHLYGRHLVLEWATEEEEEQQNRSNHAIGNTATNHEDSSRMTKLRAKAKRDMHRHEFSDENKGKKRKT